MTTPSAAGARARVRGEITQLLADAARRQLAEVGGAALSVRAVAREVGMSSSAVFRYFPSRDALLTRLVVDSYDALGESAERAEAAVHEGTVAERWRGICHGVRDWALAHPHEYALIFGSPIPGYAAPADTVGPATRVPALLMALLDAPAGEVVPTMDAALTASLAPMLAGLPAQVPSDLAMRGLMAWTYLFGAVSFEIFGHRSAVVSDPDTFFDHEVVRLAELLRLV